MWLAGAKSITYGASATTANHHKNTPRSRDLLDNTHFADRS